MLKRYVKLFKDFVYDSFSFSGMFFQYLISHVLFCANLGDIKIGDGEDDC